MFYQHYEELWHPPVRSLKYNGKDWDLKELQVNYDAIDTTVERIRRSGGMYYQTHCVIIGKVAKILYWKVRA